MSQQEEKTDPRRSPPIEQKDHLASSEAELLMEAPERDPLLESSMDTTEQESAGDDDYQGVSDSTMANAELDALLDPDSDTENPTQQENPQQQTSDSEEEGTGRPEKKTRCDAKEPGYYKKLNNGKKHIVTPESEREKDKLKQ